MLKIQGFIRRLSTAEPTTRVPNTPSPLVEPRCAVHVHQAHLRCCKELLPAHRVLRDSTAMEAILCAMLAILVRTLLLVLPVARLVLEERIKIVIKRLLASLLHRVCRRGSIHVNFFD